MKSRIRCALLLGFFLAVASAHAQQPSDFFQQNCTSCHTIGGGRLTGPDLKDVTKQKDRAWLEHFIQGPKTVMDAGDPFALQLQQDAKGSPASITVLGPWMKCSSHARSFCLVTSFKSGPVSRPPPIVWQLVQF